METPSEVPPSETAENKTKQLRKLKYTPATIKAKAKAIVAKVYAVAFYGIEAAKVATSKVNQLTAAVIDVFRSRNDSHNTDWFFTAFFEDSSDLDPHTHTNSHKAGTPSTQDPLQETGSCRAIP